MGLILQSIANIGKLSAFGVPGWNIDGALSAIKGFGEVFDSLGIQIKEPEFDLPAKGVGLLLVFQVGDDGGHLVVGGNMGKPVGKIIECHLLRMAAISKHPPDLHPAGAEGIEVDIAAIRTVFRSVVEPFFLGQPDFLATGYIHLIHIIITISRCTIDYFPVIRGNAMPIRCAERGNEFRLTA